jgi:hypothetical protein
MSNADIFRSVFRSIEVNSDYSEAVLVLEDDSRLKFCHRVGQRTARATGPGEMMGDATLAGAALLTIVLFRLNARHLDVQFSDGSRWETLFAASGG